MTGLILLSFTLPVILPFLSGDNGDAQDTSGQQPLPDFVLPAIDGSNVKLSDHTSEHSAIVLVFYRGSACQQCRDQLAEFQAGYPEIRAEGGNLFAVALGEETDAATMAEQLGVSFPMLYEGSAIATLYGIRDYLASDYTTVTLIVDSEMKPVGNAVGTQAGGLLPSSAVIEAIRQVGNPEAVRS